MATVRSAVNEVTRLEALTKELGHAMLASEDFVHNVAADWTRRHKLRADRRARASAGRRRSALA